MKLPSLYLSLKCSLSIIKKQKCLSQISIVLFFLFVFFFLLPPFRTVWYFFKINLFIYLFLLLPELGLRCCALLSLVAASRGYSSLWCTGFSLRQLLLLQSTGSRHAGFSSCGMWALEHKLRSCGAWPQLLRGMWDLLGPGLKPVSSALAGRFLTTAPPGEHWYF